MSGCPPPPQFGQLVPLFLDVKNNVLAVQQGSAKKTKILRFLCYLTPSLPQTYLRGAEKWIFHALFVITN